MFARLGVGELILVDPDVIEERNLNRIYNASHADIGRSKVDVLATSLRRIGLSTRIVPIRSTLFDAEVVRRVALADILLGCVDSVDGRDLMNRLAAYYCVPYIDIGVRLDADGLGGVDGIHGSVPYGPPLPCPSAQGRTLGMTTGRAVHIWAEALLKVNGLVGV